MPTVCSQCWLSTTRSDQIWSVAPLSSETGLTCRNKLLADNSKTLVECSSIEASSDRRLSTPAADIRQLPQPHSGTSPNRLWTVLTCFQNDLVAVIDDDPAVRKATATLLSAFGYATQTFSSAEAFLGVAATSEARCLIVDINLGDISGIELARQLADTNFRFPIIFMTALDDEVVFRQAQQLGCVAYLHKPFDADMLIEAIVRAMGHSS